MKRLIFWLVLMNLLRGCSDDGPSPTVASTGLADIEITEISADSLASDTSAPVLLVCTPNASCPAGHFCVDGLCAWCRANSDCATSAVCAHGVCVVKTPCQNDKVCKTLGLVCDLVRGTCEQCLGDLDCTSGSICLARTCQPAAQKCASTKDCTAAGLICDKQTGICVECSLDSDCPAAEWCWQTRCEPDACIAATAHCVDGKLQSCASNGSTMGLAPCPNGQTCAVDKCVPIVCVPNTDSCDGTVVKQCAADGLSASTLATCGGDQACLGGKCVAQKCTPGAQICANAGASAICKADGSGYETSACPPDSACDVGKCAAVICEVGTKSCVNTHIQTCTAAGTAQTIGADCAVESKVCSAGACAQKACDPGAKQCQGTSIATCKADAGGWSVTPCPEGTVCDDAACKVQICQPNQQTCEGTSIAICNPIGTAGQVGENCAKTGKNCVAGKCAQVACTPGQKQCNGNALQTCKADGVSFDTNQCAPGTFCQDNACKPQFCAPNVLTCQGDKAYKCSSNGMAEEFAVNCGLSNQACKDGVCLAPTCGDGKVNQASEQCDDGNTANSDGCSAICKKELVFVGFAKFTWYFKPPEVDYKTDAAFDAAMQLACKQTFGKGAPATTAQLADWQKIVGLPSTNTATRNAFPACPDCAAVGWGKCDAYSLDHVRRAVYKGEFWPSTFGNFNHQCGGGGSISTDNAVAVCIIQ